MHSTNRVLINSEQMLQEKLRAKDTLEFLIIHGTSETTVFGHAHTAYVSLSMSVPKYNCYPSRGNICHLGFSEIFIYASNFYISVSHRKIGQVGKTCLSYMTICKYYEEYILQEV